MRPPVVSVLTPTRAETRHLLPRVLRCLKQQTVSHWEWIILDDSPTPDPTARGWHTDDRPGAPRVRYVHAPVSRSLGERRNLLVALAGAPYCAHFDDDDLYGPRYLEAMLSQFVDPKIKLAKLSSWYLSIEGNPRVFHWDTAPTVGDIYQVKPSGPVRVDLEPAVKTSLQASARLGFGFSYVFDRGFAELHPFWPKNWGEDTPLPIDALKADALALVEDSAEDSLEALAVHVVSPRSTSRSYATREVSEDEITRRLQWALPEME